MPDMLAHYLVAERAAQRLDGDARLVAGAWDAYKVGAQGPDVFFYARLLRRRGRPDIAHLTHRHRMSAAFRSLLGLADDAAGGNRAPGRPRLHRRLRGASVPGRRGAPVGALSGPATSRKGPTRRARLRRFADLRGARGVDRRHPASGAGRRPRLAAIRRLLRLPAPQRKIVAGLLSAMLRDVFDATFSPEECRAAFRTMDRVYGTMSDPARLPDPAARHRRAADRPQRSGAHADLSGDAVAGRRGPRRHAALLVLPVRRRRAAGLRRSPRSARRRRPRPLAASR